MIIVLSILMVVVISKDQEIINTIPILGIFILTAIRLLPSFNRLLISIQNIKFSYPAVKTLKEELAKMNNQKIQENQITSFKKKISISNLGFSYGNKTIFDNLNFEILKGEKIGIKGETGSGKTSLVNILLGLIDINKGKIVLDDQDMTNSKLYKKIKIGYVPQSIFLVDDSIKQNIILNNQTNIDERLIEVIKISCLTDFINSLPKKYSHIQENMPVKFLEGKNKELVSQEHYLQNLIF